MAVVAPTSRLCAAPHSRDVTVAEAGQALEYLFAGDTEGAIGFLNRLSENCADEPFFLFIKSRVYRELLTVEDERKDQIKVDVRPIHADLDRIVEICTSRLAEGDNDPRLRLYRGLAWMAKSHLRSFAHSFWRAGRDAKKGKTDLEAYLETSPGDPLACGTLGAFLYFADTIPKAFKFLSRLVLLPTGDRERGLDYLRIAAEDDSVFGTDFKITLSTIYVLFEGRYEDGLETAAELLERHPRYTRIASLPLLMRPFLPAAAATTDSLAASWIELASTGPDATRYHLLRFLRAYSNRFLREPSLATSEFGALIEDNPAHPDWVAEYGHFELGRIRASHGLFDDARRLFESVTATESTGFMRGEAEEMLEDIEAASQLAVEINETGFSEVYHPAPQVRDLVTRRLKQIAAPDCKESFYLGDALLLSGDLDGALEIFETVLAMEVWSWDEEFKMLAASRAAEIHGTRGEYKAAAKSLETARKYYHKEFLLDWVLEGREQYYKRLAEGKETIAPSLYSPPPGSP